MAGMRGDLPRTKRDGLLRRWEVETLRSYVRSIVQIATLLFRGDADALTPVGGPGRVFRLPQVVVELPGVILCR